MRRADDLGRDLGEHEQSERDRDGAERECRLALAEQPFGDDRGHGRCGRGNERVAQKDHAKQFVRLGQQRQGKLCAVRSLLGAVTKPVTIDRHHRGLGDREKRGSQQSGRESREQAT